MDDAARVKSEILLNIIDSPPAIIIGKRLSGVALFVYVRAFRNFGKLLMTSYEQHSLR